MEELNEILNNLANFVAPISTTLAPEDSPADWLDNLLKEKLDSDGKEALDVRWNYVTKGLELLQKLKNSLPKDSKDSLSESLSVSQQQNVSAGIQLVIALGIVPSLLPGVGLSMAKRSKFYEIEAKTRKSDDSNKPVLEMHDRLVLCTKELLDLATNPGLSQMILTKHLGDVLAALIQLSSAPLKKAKEISETSEVEIETFVKEEFVMTQEKYEELVKEQSYFTNELQKMVDKVYPPLVVKYLLVLQSCGAGQAVKPTPKSINVKKSPTPKWVISACGSLLTHCLTHSKTGVLNVIQGILDVGNESSESNDVQRYAVIASVISNPPSTGKYADLEEYFRLVSPQILSIMDRDDESESKVYHMIACHCIRSLTERSLILSRRYLLSDLLEPLVRLCVDQTETETEEEALEIEKSREIVVSEFELDLCIKRLHLCFVSVNDPSMIFISHLQPVILVLLELHCRINFGVSHLRNSVEQIVQRFLRWCGKSVSLACTRAFALGELNPKEGQDERFKFQPMLDTYAFVAGESGGIKAIGKEFKKSEESSFYVADDEKAICLDDLMKENSDKSLGIEFYLSLLADLSALILEEKVEEKVNLEDLDSNKAKEEQLLQLERDLDSTMNSLRRKLMVIRLLGLMSEDEKLQEEVMKNPTRLIKFLSLTFQRCATMCLLRQKSPENKEEFSGGMAEMQSLQTALTLLKHIVTMPTVPKDHWESLQGTIEDLKTLSELHEDSAIANVAKKLYQLIDANIQVIEGNNEVKRKAEDCMQKTKEYQGKMEEIKKLQKDAIQERIEKETYSDCLTHLEDKEIPIRGHGLIALTALVVKRDEETMKNIEPVFKIFTESLNDEDTYIYLQAIKGLSACSFHNPEIVINRLCREYAILDDSKYPGTKGIELRTKIGEALVNVTRILGEMTPAHKNKLLNPFLAQINHPDSLIRASSLSNLGEVCKNLRFSLTGIASEIFNALHQVIQFDKAVEVRRAGIFVIKLLLEGLGDDAFGVLQGIIRDIWKTLIAQRNSEPDEVMQVHINEAIEEVNKIVKKFLTPSNELKKTIYVLDQPPL